ncbi:hypothetical protein [Mycolicibacterium arenosum]|uniref:DUF7159 domain-containing protein n=1 Tax=Mycolicibacterium arenosum TaxID=2952157 RepID=A0ABT1MAL5_9MYCO|nr:hypothetical protein [Mycolicibacterium sp. CAU 1645]MCP9275432.1 hypothetical protein [Mycolicibacterium sp. CAU 1645]
MDVVLGVAVTGPVARLAMVGSPADGGQVHDQYEFAVSPYGTTELVDTVVGTVRDVASAGHRVVATRLCVPNPEQAEELVQTLMRFGVDDVDVVSEAEAATALVRSTDGPGSALLFVDSEAATVTVIGPDVDATTLIDSAPVAGAGVTAACMTVLDRLRNRPGAPNRVTLVGIGDTSATVAYDIGGRSAMPVQVPDDPSFAIARGAAKTARPLTELPADTALAPAPGGAPLTAATPTTPDLYVPPAPTPDAGVTALAGVIEPQLAYSQVPDVDPLNLGGEQYGDADFGDALTQMPMEPLSDFIPEDDDETDYAAAPPVRPRALLLGSGIAGVVFVAFAATAVTVAISVRPTAVTSAPPAPLVKADTVPGKYLPPVPHEPDPVALPRVDLPAPPGAAPPVIVPIASRPSSGVARSGGGTAGSGGSAPTNRGGGAPPPARPGTPGPVGPPNGGAVVPPVALGSIFAGVGAIIESVGRTAAQLELIRLRNEQIAEEQAKQEAEEKAKQEEEQKKNGLVDETDNSGSSSVTSSSPSTPGTSTSTAETSTSESSTSETSTSTSPTSSTGSSTTESSTTESSSTGSSTTESSSTESSTTGSSTTPSVSESPTPAERSASESSPTVPSTPSSKPTTAITQAPTTNVPSATPQAPVTTQAPVITQAPVEPSPAYTAPPEPVVTAPPEPAYTAPPEPEPTYEAPAETAVTTTFADSGFE